MLGITLADVLAIATIVAGIVAMIHGGKDGTAGKKAVPPDPQVAVLGATMVDTATFRDLVDVLADINETMRLGISAQQERANHRFEELLEEISEKLDGEPSKPTRRRT